MPITLSDVDIERQEIEDELRRRGIDLSTLNAKVSPARAPADQASNANGAALAQPASAKPKPAASIPGLPSADSKQPSQNLTTQHTDANMKPSPAIRATGAVSPLVTVADQFVKTADYADTVDPADSIAKAGMKGVMQAGNAIGAGVSNLMDSASGPQPGADLPTSAKVMEALRSVARGFAVEIPASSMEGISFLASELDRSIGSDPVVKTEEGGFYNLAQKIRKIGEIAYPENPELQGHFYAQVLPEALGSAAGFMAPAIGAARAGEVAGLGAKAATSIAARAGIATGAVSGGASQREEAVRAWADEGAQRWAFYGGAALGATEGFSGVGSISKRLFGESGKRGALSIVRKAIEEAIEEAGQEAGQTIGGNLVAQKLYDRGRSLGQGVGPSAAAGGIVGAGLSVIASIFLGRKFKTPQEAEQAAVAALNGQQPKQTREESTRETPLHRDADGQPMREVDAAIGSPSTLTERSRATESGEIGDASQGSSPVSRFENVPVENLRKMRELGGENLPPDMLAEIDSAITAKDAELSEVEAMVAEDVRVASSRAGAAVSYEEQQRQEKTAASDARIRTGVESASRAQEEITAGRRAQRRERIAREQRPAEEIDPETEKRLIREELRSRGISPDDQSGPSTPAVPETRPAPTPAPLTEIQPNGPKSAPGVQNGPAATPDAVLDRIEAANKAGAPIDMEGLPLGLDASIPTAALVAAREDFSRRFESERKAAKESKDMTRLQAAGRFATAGQPIAIALHARGVSGFENQEANLRAIMQRTGVTDEQLASLREQTKGEMNVAPEKPAPAALAATASGTEARSRTPGSKSTPDESPIPGKAPTGSASVGSLPSDRFPVVEYPVKKIEHDPDLPNFKRGASKREGVVPGQRLQGRTYRRVPINPIVIWERENGKTVIVTGRHRLDYADRLGESTIPAQVVKESEGFTLAHAANLDAMSNIQDGKGSIYDFARFFRDTDLTQGQAQDGGLLTYSEGRAGWDIGQGAGDVLWDAFANNQISERAAHEIARTAPADDRLQIAGIEYAQSARSPSPEQIRAYLQAMSALAGKSKSKAEQSDLFGDATDAEVRSWDTESRAMATGAAEAMKELREKISAAQGAAKNPEAARKLGVDVSNPEKTKAELYDLSEQLKKWQDYPSHPKLLAEARKRGGIVVAEPEKPAEKPTKAGVEKAIRPERIAQAASSPETRSRNIADLIEQFNAMGFIAFHHPLKKTVSISGAPQIPEGEAALKMLEIMERAKAESASRSIAPASAQPPIEDLPAGTGINQQPELFRLSPEMNVEPQRAEEKPTLPEDTGTPDMFGGPTSGGSAAQAAGTWPSFAGIFDRGEPMQLGGLEQIRPIEMPELVQLATELMGKKPRVGRLRSFAGVFRHSSSGDHEIVLDFRGFTGPKGPQQAAATLAHEIGHLIDYLPDKTLSRGNLLGRLFTLRGYMKETFGPLLATNKDLKEEMLAFTRYWHPYNPDTAPAKYRKYRESARELYAELLSGILTSPKKAREIAPTAVNLFLENLHKKPAVQTAFIGVQNLIADPEATLAAREDRLVAAFQLGEEKRREIEGAKRSTTKEKLRAILQNTKAHLIDRNMAILDFMKTFVAKRPIADAVNPKFSLEEAAMADAENHALLTDVANKVILPFLEVSKMTPEAARTVMGKYALFNRIATGDRTNLANPEGLTAGAARAGLEKMQRDLGGLTWKQLERSMKRFSDMAFRLSERAVETGVYNRKLFLETIAPNRGAYSTFEVIAYMDDRISSGVKRQRGTFESVTNPFIATMLKLTTLNRAIKYNVAKRDVVNVLTGNGGEIERAKEIIGPEGVRLGFKPNKDPKLKGRIEMMDDGKLIAYDTDPYIAMAFTKSEPEQLAALAHALSFMNSRTFYPVMITFNAGYQAFNLFRDFARAWKSTKGGWKDAGGLGSLIAEYWRAQSAASRRALNVNDDTINEMIANSALDIPFSRALTDMLEEDTYERLLARMAVGEADAEIFGTKENRSRLVNALMAPANVLRYTGDRIEATTKIAGWNQRKRAAMRQAAADWRAKGMTPADAEAVRHWLGLKVSLPGIVEWTARARDRFGRAVAEYAMTGKIETAAPIDTIKKAAEYGAERWGAGKRKAAYEVRNYVGTPNFRRRGASTYITNALFMFSNVAAQGIRTDAEIAMNPETRAGFWTKTALVNIIPKLALAAAAAGFLGDELEEWLSKVSEYDRTNYLLIPLGWSGDGEDKKPVYMRIPQDETGRFIGGVFWKALQIPKRGLSQFHQVFDYGADVMPGFTPAIELGAAWWAFIAGKNPTDWFTGRSIIDPTVFEADSPRKWGEMARWSVEQTGLWKFAHYDTSNDTTAETILRHTPLVSRFVKISDAGERQEEYEVMREDRKRQAQFRLSLPDEARKLASERAKLIQKGERMSFLEKRRLRRLNGFYSDYMNARERIEKADERGQAARGKLERMRLKRKAESFSGARP